MKTINVEKLILNAIVVIISDTGEANVRADFEYLDSAGDTLKNSSSEVKIDSGLLDKFIGDVTSQLGTTEKDVSIELAKPSAVSTKEGM
jgi:hypothetical protein